MQIEVSNKQQEQIRAELAALSENDGGAQITLSGIEVIAYRAGFDLSPIKSQLDQAETLLHRGQEARERLAALLGSVGAIGSSSGTATTHNDLADLAAMNSDDSRELLDLLERAQIVAERIDATRGRTVSGKIELQPGEARGTDLAETLSVITLRIRREVHGATGKGLE